MNCDKNCPYQTEGRCFYDDPYGDCYLEKQKRGDI